MVVNDDVENSDSLHGGSKYRQMVSWSYPVCFPERDKRLLPRVLKSLVKFVTCYGNLCVVISLYFKNIL